MYLHRDITSQIRSLVSKKKKRYQKQGFDLDLSYVTDRIIAMGFPADNFEALYRNSIDDVSRFFEMNHSGKYKIYNLCRERSFDDTKFNGGEIGKFPFDDHNPPAFSILTACIEDINKFLDRHPENVVAINCKAGKGRTGVIVCCSMLYSKISKDASSALTEYGRSRTYNGKGVTIPSQIRYVFYYDHFLKHNLTYKKTDLWLRLVKFDVVPNISNSELQLAIYLSDSLPKIHLSKTYKISKKSRVVIFNEMLTFPLCGDLKFELIQKSVLGGSTVLCQCWLNTFFVVHQPPIQRLESDSGNSEHRFLAKVPGCQNSQRNNYNFHKHSESQYNFSSLPSPSETMYKVSLTKPEIDKANGDTSCRIFPAKFEMTFLFSDSPPDFNSTEIKRNSFSTTGNSIFFQTFSEQCSESMIPQLEALWKSTSSQFFFECN